MSHADFSLKGRILVAVETECCLVVEAGSCPRRLLRTWPLSSGTSKQALGSQYSSGEAEAEGGQL
jgi:hypothetical protein